MNGRIEIRVALIFIGALLATQTSYAQIDPSLVGLCETGTAESYLDVGNVRARLLNNGSLFWAGSPNVYEVPKGSGKHSIFSSSFLIGGFVNGQLRTAASTYGPYEYWPGPIETPGKPPTNCGQFDHIWTIDREKDLLPLENGIISQHVTDWPTHLGAPFNNLDEVAGFQPENGDEPAILGDQMHWWVMNDAGNTHRRSNSNPLGIEVRVSAFAFNTPTDLGNATFYRYQIKNRSTSPILSANVGMLVDADLGAAFDDYIGSDTTLSMLYFYNSDNDDDGVYGIAPPAQGISIIEATHSSGGLPTDVGAGFGSFMTAAAGKFGGHTDPRYREDFYNYMNGRWQNGQPIICGGNGLGPGSNPCPKVYPGDPVTGSYWSEMNSDNFGTVISPSDRDGLLAFGQFDLLPEETATFTFAFVWARGDSNLDSITELRRVTKAIHQSKNTLLRPIVIPPKFIDNNLSETPQHSFWLAPIYPNPSSNRATIDYSLTLDGNTKITVYDVRSREVFSMDQGLQTAGRHDVTIDTSDLKAGVYTVRLHSNRQTATRLLTVVR